MKTFLTLFIITSFVFSQASLSQSKDSEVVNLLSIEDIEVSVKLEFDYHNERLILELNPNEKMCIQGARGLDPGVKILDKKFIELHIVLRGGSEEAVRRYALICISNGKLYKSIDVISLVKNLADGNGEGVNFTGLIEKNKAFELIADGKTALHFDFDNKIFYNGYENLNGLYYVNSDKDPINKQMIFQNERFPTCSANQINTYIFIKNKWYAKGFNNHLMEFTSCCN
jgi:hypothetical protein